MVANGFATPCPAISGAEPWLGSYRPCPDEFKDADGACQHSGLVRQNISKRIPRHNDVELTRVSHQMHGRIVYIHVRKLDIRIVSSHFNNKVAPKLRGFQYIGLVDAAQLFVALSRRLKIDPRNTTHLRLGETHGVVALALSGKCAIGRIAHTPQRTKIDIAGKS